MDFVLDVENLVKEMDAGLMTADFKHLDGIVLDWHKGKLIVIDEKLDPYHRRWAIAHEIGHIKDNTVNCGYSMIAERNANNLAVDVLISDEDFLEALENYGGDYSYLCPLFGVSSDIIDKKYKKLFPEKF